MDIWLNDRLLGTDPKIPQLKKFYSTIGNNDKYLKPLTSQFFSDFRINFNDEEKHKMLRLTLRDDNYTTLVAEGKGPESIQRANELITQDKEFTKSLANQAFKDNELGK